MVVLGHMERGIVSADFYPMYNWILRGLDRFIYTFHMPLFFIISGYIFSLAYCRRKEEKKRKYKKQIINSIYVYFVFSTVQWVIQYAVSSEVNSVLAVSDLYLMPIKPMSPYWYTFVIVIYYVLFYNFDKIKLDSRIKLAILAVVSVAGSFFTFDIIFPLRLVLMHSVFFYIGIYFAENGFNFCRNTGVLVLMGIMSIGILVLSTFDILVTDVLLPAIVAVFVFCCFQKIAFFNRGGLLSFVGKYSLEIYLTHCIITAAVRVLFGKLGVNNCVLTILVGTLCGIIIPILCSMLLRKMKLYPLAFTPTELFNKKEKGGT